MPHHFDISGRVLLLVLISLLAWSLLFSDVGYSNYNKEKKQLAVIQARIAQYEQSKLHFRNEIDALRNDSEVIESYIRRKLGYVYPDEYVLMIQPPVTDPQE
ncbi:MAG: septum formation initiator family protein [Mariprofundales bacterium]